MASATKSSYHDRRVKRRLADPEYRAEYERALRQIQQIDALVNQLDELRESAGLSKAAVARMIHKDPASVRRFFSAEINPELKTVTAIADALDAEVVVKPRGQNGKRRAATTGSSRTGRKKRTVAA